MNKFVILMLCGFGDTLSAITRLPEVKHRYPNHEIVVYLGGFGKATQFSKEQLEREGYKANIIKNLNYHNQLPQMRQFLQSNIVGKDDIFEDWSFCEEIFQNQEPPFYKYDMLYPYKYETGSVGIKGTELEKYMPKKNKLIAVHPLTKSGNAEGFESDVEKGRFWSREEWKKLCLKIIDNGYVPLFTGYGDEDWGLIEELENEGYKVFDGRMDILNTIIGLQEIEGCIACNSWDWEITSRNGIPTYAFYTKNHFFIQNHVPRGPSTFWNTCFVETANEVTAEEVWEKFSYMLENKKRPDVDYDICMISYNDIDCIEKTLENVRPYITKRFVITDGDSRDGTLEILNKYSEEVEERNEKVEVLVHQKIWADNFEIQKNKSLDIATSEWRIWIDADETYEDIFWNQLPWYIWEAEKKGIDCISVPRINIIENMNGEELQEYAGRNGWQLSGFGWINYPDHQQRVFNNKCRFVGRTHERIVGYDKQVALQGIHCIHPKSRERQQRGLEREQRQYKIEAGKVRKRIEEAERKLGYL